MRMQRKVFETLNLKVLDEPEGIIEAYVSVFNNVDHAKERILPGFFKESIAKKLPKAVWMHDWKTPIGKTLEAEEVMAGDPRLPEKIRDLGGLRVVGQFNLGTQRGKEAFSDLDFGSVDEFSFGFFVDEKKYDKSTGVTDLIKGQIFEWSPVLLGCNPATQFVGSKERRMDRLHEEKAQHLGSYAEIGAALAVMSSLRWRLEDFVWDVLCDCDGDEDSLAEQMTTMRAGFDEYRELCVTAIQALMASGMAVGADGDMETVDDEDPMEYSLLGFQVRTSGRRPYEKHKAQPWLGFSGGPEDRTKDQVTLDTEIGSALGAVTVCLERAERVKAMRDGQKRRFSAKRSEQIAELKARMEKLLGQAEAPPADAGTEEESEVPGTPDSEVGEKDLQELRRGMLRSQMEIESAEVGEGLRLGFS